MMISTYSRYARSRLVVGLGGRRYLSDRLPCRFAPYPDNVVHKVIQSDTLQALAGHYFAPLPRACGLWWVIADFQPTPIVDAVELLFLQRQELIIPSLRIVTNEILPGAGR